MKNKIIKEASGWLAIIGKSIWTVSVMLFVIITLPFTALVSWFMKLPSVLDDTVVEKEKENENEN